MENEKVKNKINELELYASTMLNDKYITLSKKNPESQRNTQGVFLLI